MRASPRTRWVVVFCVLESLLVFGCTAPYSRRGVPIDSRPTPPQPDSTGAVNRPPSDATHADPQTLEQRVAADTLVASAAVKRCAGRKLLPDQEGVFDETRQLLAEVRDAIAIKDWPRAGSVARRARQLSSSLGCR